MLAMAVLVNMVQQVNCGPMTRVVIHKDVGWSGRTLLNALVIESRGGGHHIQLPQESQSCHDQEISPDLGGRQLCVIMTHGREPVIKASKMVVINRQIKHFGPNLLPSTGGKLPDATMIVEN